MNKTRLHDAFKYYKGLPHQDEAIVFLEWALSERQRQEFFRLYSPPAAEYEPFMLLTATPRFNNGLRELALHFYKDGKLFDGMTAYSGVRQTQSSWCYQTGVNSPAEQLLPLPEGLYDLPGSPNDPDVTLEWAQGRVDDYSTSWGPGLGPLWVQLEFQGRTDRKFLGMHLDGGGPGSAGCVVFKDVAVLRGFVSAMRICNPRKLYVNWGLGTCPPTPCPTDQKSTF